MNTNRIGRRDFLKTAGLETKPKWVTERLDTWHGIYGPLYGFRKDFPDMMPLDEGVKMELPEESIR